MCVICHVPADKELDKERADRLWTRNSDGGGLAYVSRRGNIVVQKDMEKESFIERLQRVQSFTHRSDLLVHMRIATQGSVSIPNVHPFWVNEPQGREDLVMAHNGVISQYSRRAYGFKSKKKDENKKDFDDRSDTRLFIDDLLNELPLDWLDNPAIVKMVADFIGGSKLMFLSTRPELQHSIYLINKEMGTERDGMWFSNNGGVDKPKVIYTPKSGKRKAKGSYTEGGYYANSGYLAGRRAIEDHPSIQGAVPKLWRGHKRDLWERAVKEATQEEVQDMIDVFNLITDDRDYFSAAAKNAVEFDGRVWWCVSCYSIIDTDEKYGWTDCKCFSRQCMECDELTAFCECDLLGMEKSRRIRSVPRKSRYEAEKAFTSPGKRGGDA